MKLLTKVGAAWKQVRRVKIKQGGIWKNVRKVFVKVSGSWKLSYVAGEVASLTTYNWVDSAKRAGPQTAQTRVTPSVPLPILGDLGWISELQMQEQYDFPIAGQTNDFVFTIIFDDAKPLPISTQDIRVTNLTTGVTVVASRTGPGSRFWQATPVGAGGYPPPPWGDLIIRNGVTDQFLFEYV